MGFSREEYWSGLPFPSPGDHPDPGIEPLSPAAPALAASLPLSHLGSPRMGLGVCYFKDGTQPGPSVLVVTYDPYGATSGASLHFFFFFLHKTISSIWSYCAKQFVSDHPACKSR